MSSEYIFMAMPGENVRTRLMTSLERAGVLRRLGRELFDPLCWHQSLSGRFLLEPSEVEALLVAGREVKTSSFAMTLNRVTGTGSFGRSETVHWQLNAKGQPEGFEHLHEDLARALRRQDVPEIAIAGNSPHITLSYRAPEPLKPSIKIDPVDWQIAEFVLVRKRKNPFGYEPVERWTLQTPEVTQGTLFQD